MSGGTSSIRGVRDPGAVEEFIRPLSGRSVDLAAKSTPPEVIGS